MSSVQNNSPFQSVQIQSLHHGGLDLTSLHPYPSFTLRPPHGLPAALQLHGADICLADSVLTISSALTFFRRLYGSLLFLKVSAEMNVSLLERPSRYTPPIK